ncbi:MAG: hypothetical protein ABSG84_10675 [Acidobacteriaceae bacterium]|jgi:hypothetical protein
MSIATSRTAGGMSTLTSEQEVDRRAALWASLVAELRSKLSSMEATGQLPKTDINEPLLHEVSMTVGDGFISVWLNADTGKGSWNAITKSLDMAEPWYITTDGVFQIDGEEMNLSAAAERFIAKVSGNWTPPVAT